MHLKNTKQDRKQTLNFKIINYSNNKLLIARKMSPW